MPYRLIAFIACCLMLTQCNQTLNADQIIGNWELLSGSKNNVESSFLDGTWLSITEEGCKSNLFSDKLSLQSYAMQDSLLRVGNGDSFRIRGVTDTTLVLEIVKSRNLFRLEMERVQILD